MKIHSLKTAYQPGFTGEIIDSHGHLGKFLDPYHGDKDFKVSQIIDTVEINGDSVEKVFVSNIKGLDIAERKKRGLEVLDELEANKQALEMCAEKGQTKVLPIAVCQPGVTKDTIKLEQSLKEGKFYGLKFHPSMTAKPVNEHMEIYSKYLKVGEQKGLPALFHSSSDGFSNPEQIINLARRHKNHPIVLYHIDLPFEKINKKLQSIDTIANAIKNDNLNLFVDISWCDSEAVKKAINVIGEDRVLFGTDIPIGEMGEKLNYENNIKMIKQAIKEVKGSKADEIINKVFYENANELFFEKKWAASFLGNAQKNTKEAIKETTKKGNKALKIIIPAFLGAGALFLLLKSKILKSKPTQNNSFQTIPTYNKGPSKNSINKNLFKKFAMNN